jgi:hypothetical protein
MPLPSDRTMKTLISIFLLACGLSAQDYVVTSSSRPSLTTHPLLLIGASLYETDTALWRIWTGAAWAQANSVVPDGPFFVATSSTRPSLTSNPLLRIGDKCFESDTGYFRIWTGSAWALLNAPGETIACAAAPGDTTGSFRQQCQVASTGALWTCNNAAGCTLGAHWVAVGTTPVFASQAEAEAGADNTKMMTPLRTAQAITEQAVTKDEDGNVAIGATIPGGAPDNSLAVGGKIYGDGSELTGVASGESVTWVLCAAAACTTADVVANPWIATQAWSSATCYIAAGTPPTGTGGVTVSITKNGSAAFSVTLPSGTMADTAPAPTASEVSGSAGDVLKASITAVGGTVPGAAVTLRCKLQ